MLFEVKSHKSQSRATDKQRAFTFVEALVVVAILLVLAALLVPVIDRAKKSGMHAKTLSNLRQCASALVIYEADEGDLPVGTAADFVLASAPTCDPFDKWRANCHEDVGHPVIGSYGYSRLVEGLESKEEWNEYLNRKQLPRLLVSIHEASMPIARFDGQRPLDFGKCAYLKTCIFPDRLIVVGADTHAKAESKRTFTFTVTGNRSMLFTWRSAFDEAR